MVDFIVNEANHVIDMDEQNENLLEIGEKLPTGQVIAEISERTSIWQIFITEDGAYKILVVGESLYKKWIEGSFLDKNAFALYENSKGKIVRLLISPASLMLASISSISFDKSLRMASSFAGAIWHSRSLDHDVNLRDAIFCELYSVMLPTFTQTRKVADIALFRNCMRGNNAEDLSSPDEIKDSGLSYFSFVKALSDNGIKVNTAIEPVLELGETVDDFVDIKGGAVITAPLVLTDNYQLYATNKDVYVLLFERKWASKLIDENLLLQMDFKNVQVGSDVFFARAFSKRYALEPLNARHYGQSKESILDLASCIYHSRQKMPKANLNTALYLGELNILLPECFDSENINDRALIEDVLVNGPFALAPFSYELTDDVITLVTR